MSDGFTIDEDENAEALTEANGWMPDVAPFGKHYFKVGDKVKHTAKFLKSIGWCLDVPKYGIVTGFKMIGPLPIVYVLWIGDEAISGVNEKHLMPFGKPDYTAM